MVRYTALWLTELAGAHSRCDLFAMYVLSSELGRPGYVPTYCLHLNSDRAYAERGQMLPGVLLGAEF